MLGTKRGSAQSTNLGHCRRLQHSTWLRPSLSFRRGALVLWCRVEPACGAHHLVACSHLGVTRAAMAVRVPDDAGPASRTTYGETAPDERDASDDRPGEDTTHRRIRTEPARAKVDGKAHEVEDVGDPQLPPLVRALDEAQRPALGRRRRFAPLDALPLLDREIEKGVATTLLSPSSQAECILASARPRGPVRWPPPKSSEPP
jgi:hypothetical protein